MNASPLPLAPIPPENIMQQSQTAPSEEANAQLYQALMRHKQLEQQKVRRILSDTQSITEAMIQKQREAQQSKLVVSAIGEQYVNNARYLTLIFPLCLPLDRLKVY